jgi:uncharacterized protein YbjT (DUF2867 family)
MSANQPRGAYRCGVIPPRKILVAGATGYVGGRLVLRLLEAGHEVRVIARNPARAREYSWSDSVELVVADVLDRETLDGVFAGCSVAYYLVNSTGSQPDFERDDARGAANFRDAAEAEGIERIVYLGAMGGDGGLSAQLASRHRVGRILADGTIPVTELRAGVIIGSGSLSFEMIRYLTEVLPVMVTPNWVRTRCQPIAIRDVLFYLVRVLDDPETVDRVLQIGGPDIVSYQQLLTIVAEVIGLRRRVIVPVPWALPGLSSRWVGLVTPLPSPVARPLVDSLREEAVMTDHSIESLVPHQPIDLHTAIELALRRTSSQTVETRWSDAGYIPAETIPGDPQWAGGSTYSDHQTVETTASPSALFDAFARIGGDNGYYVLGWAWRVRGAADRLIGGPGLRRGRRHPVDLRSGEALDFWRVTKVEPGHELVLEAEMKVPGRAWLGWSIEGSGHDGRPIRLHQTASFAPRGLWGRAYWFSMLPFHWVIFARMAKSIVRHAEATPLRAAEPEA